MRAAADGVLLTEVWCSAQRDLVVQASAKNVNRVRALLGQLAQCAADNFADKQPGYYAHTTVMQLCWRAKQTNLHYRQTFRFNKRAQKIALGQMVFSWRPITL